MTMRAMVEQLRPRRAARGSEALAEMQRERLRSILSWGLAGMLAAGPLPVSIVSTSYAATPVMPWVWPAVTVNVLIAVWAYGVALAQFVLFVRAEPRRAGRAVGLLAALLGGLVLGAVSPILFFGGGLLVLGAPVIVIVACALSAALVQSHPWRPARPWRPALWAFAATLSMIALGLFDGLVAMPLALGGGAPLGEVYQALHAHQELGGITMLLIGGGLWTLAAAAVAGAVIGHRMRGGTAVGLILGCGIAWLSTLTLWEFGMGSGLADALSVGGGTSWLLSVIGVVVALAGVIAALALGGLAPARVRDGSVALGARANADEP